MKKFRDVAEPIARRTHNFIRHRDTQAVVIICIAIILCNSIYLFMTNQNPLIQRSGLPITAQEKILSGENTLDPNDGFTSQALGVAAANQVATGQMPWWNEYEGVGVPLVAEMQSAALFPYTMLLLLPGGSLIFHIALEITAAIGMYLLLQRLRINRKIAIVGGILFGVSGTFSWLTNAAFNPIAFLPWTVLGVELVRSALEKGDVRRRIIGLLVIGVSIALSLYAGFPETAYIDGLLVTMWAIVRLAGIDKQLITKYILTLLGAAILSVLLSVLVLIPFMLYLPDAYTGGHEGGGFSGLGLIPAGFSTLFMPYIYGPMNAMNTFDSSSTLIFIWGNIGGYIGIGAVMLALLAFSKKDSLQGLKIALLVWAVVAITRIFAVPVIAQLVDTIPAISLAAVFRYVPPSVSFALIVLAAMGLQNIYEKKITRVTTLVATLATLSIVAWSLVVYFAYGPDLEGAPRYRWWLVGSTIVAVGVVGAILLALRLKTRWSSVVIGAIVVAESAVLFLIPQLSAPTRPASVDTAAVSFLKQNIGTNRFYTLGPIAPNYGSYFGVASINNNDLPVPALWANYITKSLNENTNPVLFIGSYQKDPKGPTSQDEFFDKIDAYSNAGVKYLVASSSSVDQDRANFAGLKEVYDDTKIAIYQLGSTRPYIDIDGDCTHTVNSRTEIQIDCQDRASLVRLELYFKGWTARVNGVEVPITKKGIFQSIEVPAGASSIVFKYEPPYLNVTYILFSIGVATVVILSGIAIRSSHDTLPKRITKRRKNG
ncbi:MAG: hypothetical protein JWN75_804 [Candidatus Saccharibacteria bacterium]|nr:hypothetical protein [Candidatus Saccharibacteria bacterium]